MPFQTVKLLPGVRAEQTPLLLQAGIVQSNNIRWKDGLPEKLGGWQKFYYTDPELGPVTPSPLAGPIRELWPWADFISNLHLAAAGDAGLDIVTDGGVDITPQYIISNISPAFSTTAGSPLVTVDGVDPNLTTNLVGTLVVDNYVSVGGIILYGPYSIEQINSHTEVVISEDENATATVVLGGAVSTFATNGGSEICTVHLPNHGVSAGQTVTFLPTTLTGSSAPGNADIVVAGSYEVRGVVDANNFFIGLAFTPVNSVGPIPENGGNVQLTFWVVQQPLMAGGPYGAGAYGAGFYGAPATEVTPIGTANSYGVGPYSAQNYGLGAVSGTKVTAANLGVPTLDWCLTNFGETLIAQPEGGGFFAWTAADGYLTAQPIPQAPAAATGFFLAMPQQQLVAYGASTGSTLVQDPMLVRWCDNADYTDWTAAVNNQAGSYRLTRGSMIVGALQAPMQAMLWTDIGLWLMTYIGYPDVWGFMEVAQECGLIAKKAAGVCGGQTFWMARDKFWTFLGGQVAPLPCEVWDAVFQNLNLNLLDRIRCSTNAGFDEVWWFYPSIATQEPGALQENDSWVKFNRVSGEWDYGTPIDVFGDGASGGLMISDWIDNNVFGHPISAMTLPGGVTSQLMWQEMGRDADTSAMDWWFRTGLFLLNEGEDFMFVDRCRPDFRYRKFGDPVTKTAQVQITLYSQDESDNPSKPPAVYGPFLCSDSSGPFDPRARGRYFSLKVEGNDLGSFARLGAVKFRFCPDGRSG
jgi:hypothetical protein